VTATVSDDQALGVFKVSATLSIVGSYSLEIVLGGKSVPTSLSSPIIVTPSATTSAVTSNFTGVLQSYSTGQSVNIYIQARDQFNNLRGSTNDVFTLSLTGQTTGQNYGPFTAVSN
jgi:hypothetical protein